MKIGLHTVFIAKENILFLSEWIAYHYSLGIDRFYLYDNTGVRAISSIDRHSIGKDNLIPMKVNRYGERYDDTVLLSNLDIQIEMQRVQSSYPDGVVQFTKWQPKNKNGEVTYGQVKGQTDNLNKARDCVDWMIQIDMDEFLVSNGDLKEIVYTFDKDDFHMIKFMTHLIMPTRYESHSNYIIDVPNSNASGWVCKPPKYIYKTKYATKPKIHGCDFSIDINKHKDNGKYFYIRHHKLGVDDYVVKSHSIQEMNDEMNNLHQIPQKIIDKTKSLCGNEELINWRSKNIKKLS